MRGRCNRPAPRAIVGWGFASAAAKIVPYFLPSPSFRQGVVRTARRSTRELSPHPRPDCKQDDCKTRPENSQIACFARRLDAGNQPDWSLRWQSRRVRSLATRPPSVPAGSYLDARACVLLPTGPPTRLASAPSAFRGPSALAKQLEPCVLDGYRAACLRSGEDAQGRR
jgi:hypothetical protein